MKHLLLYEAHSNKSKFEMKNWILNKFHESLLRYLEEKKLTDIVTNKTGLHTGSSWMQERTRITKVDFKGDYDFYNDLSYSMSIVWPPFTGASGKSFDLRQFPTVTLTANQMTTRDTWSSIHKPGVEQQRHHDVYIKLNHMVSSASYTYTDHILKNFNNEDKPFTDSFLRSIISDIKWIVLDYFVYYMIRHLKLRVTQRSLGTQIYYDNDIFIKFMMTNQPKYYAIALDDIYHRYLNKPSLLSTKIAEVRKKTTDNEAEYTRVSRLNNEQRQMIPAKILQETWITAEVLDNLKKNNCENCQLYEEAIKIKFSEATMSSIKKLAPDVFNDIKSSRQIEDQWKDDLKADLGDIGF